MSEDLDTDLDTDINNYTDLELLEIAGFDGTNIPNKDQINTKFNLIISKYTNNNPYRKFFKEALTKLNNVSNNELNIGSNQIIYGDKTDIQNVVPLDINVGTVNPNLIQTISKYITIYSKHRQHIVPYSCNPNSKTSSTKFLCSLSEKIKNTVRLKMYSITIPRTWYAFDDYIGTTCFFVDYETVPITKIHITEGNYTPQNLITEIQNKITEAGLDISVNLVENILTSKIKFTNNDASACTIYFYKYDNSLVYDISCTPGNNINNIVKINKYDQNLGYNLGFRITNINEQDLKITLDASGGNKIADAPIDIIGTQYLTLVIDDFNYNHINNGGITIENKSNKIDLPSYYGTILQDISYIDASNQTAYLPTFPRKLTQSQIYSINEINSQKKEESNRTVSYNNSNIMAIIHLPSITLNEDNRGMSYNIEFNNQSLNTRIYFGPVCIEKLDISLYDDKGNILNLHGHDWSLTMIAEELYKN